MEGVKDKGIGCRGSGKSLGEGGINEVDEKGVGEKGDILIVGV